MQGDEFSCFTVQANLYRTWTERRPQSCCNKCSHLLPLRLLLPQQSKPLCSEHTPGLTRGVLGCKILSGVLFMMGVNVKSSEQKSSFIRFVCFYRVTQKNRQSFLPERSRSHPPCAQAEPTDSTLVPRLAFTFLALGNKAESYQL